MTDTEKLDLILSKFGKVENDIADIKLTLGNDITDIKLTLENEIRPNIMRVAEGHLDLYRKLNDASKIENEKEMLSIRVSILETELRKIKSRLDQIA